jgi:hypothetical protein
MPTDFSAEYVQRGDEELLLLATQRHSLTTEAATALDAELRRRNLTESDRVEHQKFAKRQERKEHNRRRRKLFGKRQFSWLELLSGFGALGVIAWAYFSLPKRYHLTANWEETAVCVVIPSVFVIVGWRSLWREVAFWLSLILSSAIQLAIVHVWVQRAGGELSRGAGKLATFLGFGLFLAVYGFSRLVRRNFYGEESPQVR